MFTGLIQCLGKITVIQHIPGGLRLTVDMASAFRDLELGESIAINGCCLTVIDHVESQFTVEAGAETLARTGLGSVRIGEQVNLERAICAGDRFGGHFVTGHIDCQATIVTRDDHADWSTIRFEIAQPWIAQIAPKGSVAIDGVSLTVVDVTAEGFSVALIPFTLSHTTLGKRTVGEQVNIETDLLAKYVSAAAAMWESRAYPPKS